MRIHDKFLNNVAACLATISALCVFIPASAQERPEKPNIVVLLADDLGYGELGSYGQAQIKTPFLDTLAARGMRFTDFYAGSALCSPSRAVLMTGVSSGKNSIRGNTGFHADRGGHDRVSLLPSEQTIAEMLKPAGYETIFVGKWHLDDPYDLGTWATARGFDYSVQQQWPRKQGPVRFDEDMYWVNGLKNAIRYDYRRYSILDEFYTDQALDYLERREREDPFFLFMSYRVPHANEPSIRNNSIYADRGWPEAERRHAARITLLDEQIGRLIRYLERTGAMDNTLLIFTSDNGGHVENGHDHTFFKSNGVFRGHKRDLYEGGVRVPMFAVWADKIKAGTVSDHVGSFQDIMPTLADAAGVRLPDRSDGLSIFPTLLGQGGQRDHYALYWELHLNKRPVNGNDRGFRQAIRQGKWKAVRYGAKSATELYDLSADAGEADDLSSKHPARAKAMTELFQQSSHESDRYYYGGNGFRLDTPQ